MIARNELIEEKLRNEVVSYLSERLSGARASSSVVETAADLVKIVLEKFVFERSQVFAIAVKNGNMRSIADDELKTHAISVLNSYKMGRIRGVDWVSVLCDVVVRVLLSRNSEIQAYLRSLSDGFTLMAFLKYTQHDGKGKRRI